MKGWSESRDERAERNPEQATCPVCGFYCLGRGGAGCIDKPGMVHAARNLSDEKLREKRPDSHYRRYEYKGVKLDPYRIALVYNMRGGPREQIMKKCLRFTDKGQTEREVVADIRKALERWEELLDEDEQ